MNIQYDGWESALLIDSIYIILHAIDLLQLFTVHYAVSLSRECVILRGVELYTANPLRCQKIDADTPWVLYAADLSFSVTVVIVEVVSPPDDSPVEHARDGNL